LNPHLILYSLVFVMVLCWSGNYVAAKIVFREIPAMLAMALRTIVSAILMAGIYWRRPRGVESIWTRREMGILIALGLFGMVMNQFFWTIGVSQTTVVHSSMIMATTPIWVLLMAGLMGLEPITFPKVGGMAIAMTGVAMLQVFRPKLSAQSPTLRGDFFILLCTLALAGMTAFGKRYRPRSGGIAVNAVGYILGAFLLLPSFWFSSRGFDFGKVTAGAWMGVVYMGAISSVTGYLIYYYALARMSASRMAAFQYLQPVFASLMAVVMLGEELTGAALAAGGIIFAGVFVTERFG
jgi:drug/metabolite transporter (DMT)-like permease